MEHMGRMHHKSPAAEESLQATGRLLSPEVDCGQFFSFLSAADQLGLGLQLAGQGVAKDRGTPVSCPDASIQESLPVFPHS